MNALFDAVIRGSIRHRVLVLFAAAALVVGGVLAAGNARLDALPDFTPPLVTVQAEAQGLDASAVERLVTTPLEQALLGIPDVARLHSTSSPGLAVLQLTFEDDVDVFRARQLVAERVAAARERLPPSLPAPQMAPITAPVGALLKLCYTVPGDDPEALRALRRFARWKAAPRLQAIEGVARVTVHGGGAPRVEVRPRPEVMLARGVTLSDLRDALAGAQSLAPLGHVVVGAQQQPVRAQALFEVGDLDAVAATVIRQTDGLPVRVGDVADVVAGEAPPVGSALYDGHPAVYLQIEKLPWADTPRLTATVERALVALDAELPQGAVRQAPTFRQADFIRTSLVALARAMGLGALLVVVVLVSFLRSPRLAAVSLTALPLSVLAAAAVLLFRGVTLNGMILGGLAIAVGEVVDDAIVDVENIWRRLRENAASAVPRAALDVVRDASAEVRSAVVYASLIVVVVLLPVILLGGLAGRIFSPLAVTYALAVAASLVVALTVTPAMSALLLPAIASGHDGHDEHDEHDGHDAGDTRLARALRRGYDRVLAGVARRPGAVVVVAAVVAAAALAVLPFVGGGFLPEFREGVLIAEVTAWPGTSLEETTALGARVDAALRRAPGLPHVAVHAGRASLDEDAAPVNRMEMDLVLPADAGDPDEVAAAVGDRIAEVPGVRFGVEGFLGERIDELLSGERAPIAVKLFGDDLDALRGAARTLLPRLAAVDGVRSARAASLVDVPTTDVALDDARLAVAGVRRGDVVDAVAAWRRGLEVADANAPGGFRVPVVIAGGDGWRGRQRLADLPVFSHRGGGASALPLSSLATLEDGAEPARIDHEGGRRVVTITARAAPGELSGAAARIERVMAAAALPKGAAWQLAGQAVERRSASARLALVAGLVTCALFAFLWMAFGSVVDAGVILGGLPLGMAGGVVGALLLPDGLSMAGLVGFVTLAGIISRNGIMLVAHKNQLLARGRVTSSAEVEAVVLQAARERLVPIAMTAGAAFFGLLPLAASLAAAGSELEAPMAFIVCFGLVTSTALNLVAVPAFYVWRARRRA